MDQDKGGFCCSGSIEMAKILGTSGIFTMWSGLLDELSTSFLQTKGWRMMVL